YALLPANPAQSLPPSIHSAFNDSFFKHDLTPNSCPEKSGAVHYRGLQAVRENEAWEEWVLYMLSAVEETSRETLTKVREIRDLMQVTKQRLRQDLPKLYSQDLLNNLFRHPYTKIEFIERDLGVSRPTATKYLTALEASGFVRKMKLGRTNFYINEPLFKLLSQ
ncbi:MAG: hypothetical protein KBF29_04500, partial [Sterolibacterium sp.]|nr:hypothetical protein [Sterolibacterium sp.]